MAPARVPAPAAAPAADAAAAATVSAATVAAVTTATAVPLPHKLHHCHCLVLYSKVLYLIAFIS